MPSVRYIGLAAMMTRGIAAVRQATVECAEDLVARAVEVTPIEEGTLRGGIHVDSVEQTGTTVTAIVATGAESSAYAAYIHEGMRADGSHVIVNYHGGGGKYLEGPLLAMGPVYHDHMSRAARMVF